MIAAAVATVVVPMALALGAPPAWAGGGALPPVDLPGGARLVLDATGVQVQDAQGQVRDRLPVRAKRWDVRREGERVWAVVLDADRQETLQLEVTSSRLQLKSRIASPAFALQTLCLYRDAQGLHHVFLIGDEGRAEQWLLDTAPAPRPVRSLAVVPEAQACEVDDARAVLRVRDEEGRVEQYTADAEQALRRVGADAAAPSRLPIVAPRGQTRSVGRFGDAADDPAIWVHPRHAMRSRVLGTNKKAGLLVYDLDGREVQSLPVGRVNNVDVRQRVRLGGPTDRALDIAVATQRDDHSIVVFEIDPRGRVHERLRIATGLPDIYGVCLYQPPTGGLEIFVNDKDGRFQRHALVREHRQLASRLQQQFKLDSQPEACVADDRAGQLYIGEEKRGVWVMPLRAAAAPALTLAVPVGGLLVPDVEGLALHHSATGSHLVISSQGNHSYVVADAAPPYTVRGAFRIGIHAALGIDGTSETDGLEVSAAVGAPRFPGGLLVVQDGHKRLPDGPQNFKYVAWDDVVRALGW